MFYICNSIVKVIKGKSLMPKLSIVSKLCIVNCALSIVLVGCSTQPQSSQNEIETPVSVQELKLGSIDKLINSSGNAFSTYSINLTSEMAGDYYLQTNPRTGKPFKLGDEVKKGQVIVKFENREYENQVSIGTRKLNLEITEAELVNQTALREKGGVTLTEIRNAEVRAMNAKIDLDNAEISLNKMNVVAPFDGVIVDLPHYTNTSRVSQNSAIVSLMDYSHLYMEINLPESAIAYVKANQPVHITHTSIPEDTIMAIISEMSPAISTETRTFKSKVLIDNKELKIRPGMFVKADIVVDQAENTIVIPKDVITSNRNRKHVYVVERNTAVMRQITTGLEDETNVQVIDGLFENDNLVIRGQETLRDNSRVKVLK
jgi:RND family efflux transporter, MFP subunit